MAERLCVFLRGVNVNGVKMKMDDLKKSFDSMSFSGARTILATGNVIITAKTDDLTVLKNDIERNLSAHFSYDAHVFLRTEAALQSVLASASAINIPQGCHLYYLICDDKDVIGALGRLFEDLPHQANEAYIPIEHGAFWMVPIGATLDSAFGNKALGAKKYKTALTSRNINTIEKITRAMRD